MDIRFATDAEVAAWDDKLLAGPDGGNVFQSHEFAEQKKLGGWTPRYVMAGDMAVTVLEKSLTGLGKLWYAPKGPGVATVVQLGDMLRDLQRFAAGQGVFVVKLEPELARTSSALLALKELELVEAAPIQPNNSTVVIDLSPDVDTIMANFNQKGRHAVRRAERDGVTVKKVDTSDENCKIFYDLLVQTAEGQGFASSLRTYEYYREFWQRFVAADMGQLFFAYFDGQIVAGAFALVFGHKSTYKDGASLRVDGAYGVTHLLQWHVMQWAKDKGSLAHDLCGTPASDQIDNPEHPHYGIGRFKTSFNKEVTDYIGVYDLVVKPRQYGLWTRFGERVTKSLWWRKYHESWY